MTTARKKLDHKKAKECLDLYFDRISEIRKKMSSHISFMPQDVIDLRKDGWVPFHQESLETIKQIRHKTQPERKEGESPTNLKYSTQKRHKQGDARKGKSSRAPRRVR